MRSLTETMAIAKQVDARAVASPPAPTPKVIVARRFSDIVEETVSWLWRDWIARGKLHLLAGVQGDGKSTIATDLAARLSCGLAMPDGSTAELARVGFLISEDGVSDTVLPRLRIHGADLEAILAIEAVRTVEDKDEPINFALHLPELEQFVVANQLDLLIVDALSDFMGSTKRNDEGEVRSVLTPLAQLAGRTGCAVVGIVHLGKPGAGARRAVERVLGSGAFTQVARIVWAVGVDPEDEAKRYFGQVKNNLAPDVPTLAWHRERDQPISWDGISGATVKAVMSGAHEKATKTDRAVTFLAEFLKGGGKPSGDVFREGRNAGIGRDALYTAAEELGISKEKEARVGGQWIWRLPPGSPGPFDTPPVSSGYSETSGTSVSSGSSVDVPEVPEVPDVPEGAEASDSGTARDQSDAPSRDDVRATYHFVPGQELLTPEHPLGNIQGTAAGLALMTPVDLAAYRAELEAAPDDDPDLEHDRAALALLDRQIAELESMKQVGDQMSQVGRKNGPAPERPMPIRQSIERLRDVPIAPGGPHVA